MSRLEWSLTLQCCWCLNSKYCPGWRSFMFKWSHSVQCMETGSMWGVKGHTAQRSWCWRVKSNLWTDGQTDRQTDGRGHRRKRRRVRICIFACLCFRVWIWWRKFWKWKWIGSLGCGVLSYWWHKAAQLGCGVLSYWWHNAAQLGWFLFLPVVVCGVLRFSTHD